MLRIDHALRSDRVLKALTGLSIVEFIDLTARFEAVLDHRPRPHPAKKRQRQPGGGRKPRLSSAADTLFFILFYVKFYPTFDVAGCLYDVHRAQPHRWVHTLLPVLEQTLGEAVVLPERKINDVAVFLSVFPTSRICLLMAKSVPPNGRRTPTRKKRTIRGRKNATRGRISSSVMSTAAFFFSRPPPPDTSMTIPSSKRATFWTKSRTTSALGSI